MRTGTVGRPSGYECVKNVDSDAKLVEIRCGCLGIAERPEVIPAEAVEHQDNDILAVPALSRRLAPAGRLKNTFPAGERVRRMIEAADRDGPGAVSGLVSATPQCRRGGQKRGRRTLGELATGGLLLFRHRKRLYNGGRLRREIGLIRPMPEPRFQNSDYAVLAVRGC